MNNKINIQDLDFFEIKEKLKKSLKGQNQFQDYDFEGSSMNIHLDLLSEITNHMGFYAHMLNNESNIDSAMLKPSLTSKAKFQNYIPGSKRSSKATVKINVDVSSLNQPINRRIVIPRGTSFKSNNNSLDNRSYMLIDDLFIYNQSNLSNEFNYVSDDVLLYEGEFQTESFTYDSSILNQRFIIRDNDIDINTIRVKVFNIEGDETFTVFNLAEDFMTINSNSDVFFLSVNEEGFYELKFGNGVYGSLLNNENHIEISYISTSGVAGNNAKSFILGGVFTYNNIDYNLTVDTVHNSEGGSENESIDELRFNIPNHFRNQNRGVIVDDYKSILLRKYRNINSINVWGGEDNIPPAFGKIFISIKPKFGEKLSSNAKQTVRDIINKSSLVEAVVIDPDFLYLNLNVNVIYNPINTDKSSGEIQSSIESNISLFNDEYLNKFDGFYSDLELNNTVKNSNNSIISSYTDITLEKRINVELNLQRTYSTDFQNEILPNTFKSSLFEFRLFRCFLKDDGLGSIKIMYFNTLKSEFEEFDEIFGEVDYEKGIVRLIDFQTSNLFDESNLSLLAAPKIPDFFSKRNSIVTIDNTIINVKSNFENENEK